jgi:hypothetical protein
MSIPELAQQMGHSAQMTVGTYTHVIRELKGQPIMAPRTRSSRPAGKMVHAWWTSTPSEALRRDSEHHR